MEQIDALLSYEAGREASEKYGSAIFLARASRTMSRRHFPPPAVFAVFRTFRIPRLLSFPHS